jgi:ABC-type phosphate transport system substrate-binding protein
MRHALVLLSSLLVLVVVGAAPSRAEAQGFRVVIHPSNPATALPKAQVSQLFLKKVTRWPDGRTVKPVEPPARSSAREAFCEAVHGKSSSAVRSYWNQLIFTGRDVPPVEKESDEEVVAYVRGNEAAIGVVSTGAALAGVKVLELR